jgi:glycosyltransferase involved in cell wall biosynthesis
MKLSVIVPCYNVQNLVGDCIKSILEAFTDYNNFYEIILVDDGSTDQTKFILEDINENYSEVILIRQKNKGLSGARNTGLENAKGQYIWFVDGDDTVKNNSAEILFTLLNNSSTDVFCLEANFIQNKKRLQKDKRYPQRGEVLHLNELKIQGVWNNIFRRNFLLEKNLSFTDRLIHEDFEYLTRALVLSNKTIYSDEKIYNYFLLRPGSIATNKTIKNVIGMLLNVQQLNYFLVDKNQSIKNKKFVKKRMQIALTSSMMYSSNLNKKDFKLLRNEFFQLFKDLNLYHFNFKTIFILLFLRFIPQSIFELSIKNYVKFKKSK